MENKKYKNCQFLPKLGVFQKGLVILKNIRKEGKMNDPIEIPFGCFVINAL